MNNNNIKIGAFFMFISVSGFALMDICVKWLGEDYSVGYVVFWRMLGGLIPLVFTIPKDRWSSLFKTSKPKLHFVRAFTGTVALFCIYTSLHYLPLATTVSLTFASPIFTTLLSIFILGEVVRSRRWTAIIVGFIGVVLITKPGSDLFTYYSLLPLLVAIFWSIAMIVLKFIPDSVSTAKIQFYSLLFSIIGAIFLYIFTSDHQTIASYKVLSLMVATGVLGGIAAILFIYAYRLVEASKLTSFEYLAIPSSFIMGWFFFKEAPLDQLFPGVIAIILAGMIIIWRDSHREGK